MAGEHQGSETMRGAHVTECLSYNIDPTGERAVVVFKIEDGTKFAITIPTGGLNAFLSMVKDVKSLAEKRSMSTGSMTFHRPTEFQVGHSDQMRGWTVISFDPSKSTEENFAIKDADALKLSKLLESDVMARMTKADLQKMQTAPGRTPSGLIVPAGIDFRKKN